MISQQTRTAEEHTYAASRLSVSTFLATSAQSDGSKLTLSLPRHPEFCPQRVRPTLTEQLEEELCMASLFPGGGELLSKYDCFMTGSKK